MDDICRRIGKEEPEMTAGHRPEDCKALKVVAEESCLQGKASHFGGSSEKAEDGRGVHRGGTARAGRIES